MDFQWLILLVLFIILPQGVISTHKNQKFLNKLTELYRYEIEQIENIDNIGKIKSIKDYDAYSFVQLTFIVASVIDMVQNVNDLRDVIDTYRLKNYIPLSDDILILQEQKNNMFSLINLLLLKPYIDNHHLKLARFDFECLKIRFFNSKLESKERRSILLQFTAAQMSNQHKNRIFFRSTKSIKGKVVQTVQKEKIKNKIIQFFSKTFQSKWLYLPSGILILLVVFLFNVSRYSTDELAVLVRTTTIGFYENQLPSGRFFNMAIGFLLSTILTLILLYFFLIRKTRILSNSEMSFEDYCLLYEDNGRQQNKNYPSKNEKILTMERLDEQPTDNEIKLKRSLSKTNLLKKSNKLQQEQSVKQKSTQRINSKDDLDNTDTVNDSEMKLNPQLNRQKILRNKFQLASLEKMIQKKFQKYKEYYSDNSLDLQKVHFPIVHKSEIVYNQFISKYAMIPNNNEIKSTGFQCQSNDNSKKTIQSTKNKVSPVSKFACDPKRKQPKRKLNFNPCLKRQLENKKVN